MNSEVGSRWAAFFILPLHSSSFIFQRRGPGRRRSAAGANVAGTAPGVFFRAEIGFLRGAARDRLVEQPLQIAPAPAAARAGAETFAQLSGAARLLHSQEVE